MKALIVATCGSKKRSYPCAARDLYVGSFFAMQRRYAERFGAAWLILSAKHGLVEPGDVLAPYNLRMGEASSVTPDIIRERRPTLFSRSLDCVIALGGVAYTTRLIEAYPDDDVRLFTDTLRRGERGMGYQLSAMRNALDRGTP